MSELPENEKLNGETVSKEANETAPAAEKKFETEGSTIFQKHEYDTKAPVKKGNVKRLVTVAVALLLCGVIVLGIFGINKFLPNDTESSGEALEKNEFTVLSASDYIKETTVTVDGTEKTVDTNIKYADFNNYYSAYRVSPTFTAKTADEIAAEKEKNASSDTSASASEKKVYDCRTEWQVEGIDPSMTVSSTIATAVRSCLNIKAIGKIEYSEPLTEKEMASYEFTDAYRTFNVEFSDGTAPVSITVGKQNATGTSNYLCVSGDYNVYIVETATISNFDYLPIHFGDTEMKEAMEKTDDNAYYFNESGELARFDSIKLYGHIFGNDKVEIRMNSGVSADYMPYEMVSPYKRPASESWVENILNLAANGITADSLYSFKATDENRDIGGINDPNCVIEFKAGSYSFKLTIGGILEDDSEQLTAVIDGKQPLYSMPVSTFGFITGNYEDMFNSNFIMEDIYKIKNVTFTTGGNSYKFNLTHKKRADTEKAYDTTVTLDGKTLNDTSFKYLYQRVLLLSLLNFTTKADKAEPVLSIRYTFIEGNEDKLVELTPSSTDRYHYIAWVDGTPLGEVLKTSVDDILVQLNTYVSGGEVKQIS